MSRTMTDCRPTYSDHRRQKLAAAELADRLGRLVSWYETLSPATLADLPLYYAGDARFKDPFNETGGVAAIERVFRHMFEQLDEPRFVVTGTYLGNAAAADEAMLCWRLHFRHRALGKAEQVIVGSTLLRFDPGGRVSWHRDYWDTAEELFAKLPLIGPLTRGLTRQFASR